MVIEQEVIEPQKRGKVSRQYFFRCDIPGCGKESRPEPSRIRATASAQADGFVTVADGDRLIQRCPGCHALVQRGVTPP